MAKKKNIINNLLAEIKDTLFPEDENDTPSKKASKKTGWVIFLILMGCGSLSMLIALSFAH